MTVLEEYQRLEAAGVWNPGPDAQRRDVVISVGDATLILYDLSETALAHWSLPALERLNPGQSPAIYAPGTDAPDRLEVSDTEMIQAIERVRTAITAARGRPGRLRALIGAGLVVVLLAAAVFWLPGAVARYAASILPDAARVAIGQDLLREVRRLSGPACNDVAGVDALRQLERHVFPDGSARLQVLPRALSETTHLPGGMLLISHTLVEDHETPDVLAGYLLAEAERRSRRDPTEDLLRTAGLRATLTLLTTGRIPDAALADYAEARLSIRPEPVDAQILLPEFARIGISPAPYAYARDISGETTLALVEGAQLASADQPLLPDSQWIALQQICER